MTAGRWRVFGFCYSSSIKSTVEVIFFICYMLNILQLEPVTICMFNGIRCHMLNTARPDILQIFPIAFYWIKMFSRQNVIWIHGYPELSPSVIWMAGTYDSLAGMRSIKSHSSLSYHRLKFRGCCIICLIGISIWKWFFFFFEGGGVSLPCQFA